MTLTPAKAYSLNPLHVLIVDDAHGMRACLNTVLTSAGFICTEARDGAEALGIVFGGGVDLVVTDLDMPKMDGFGLISAISVVPPGVRPPVIVLSGRLNESLASRRPELRNAAALLAKPLEPAVLLATMERVMGARARCA